jgi:putative Mg2+ transporter-C (MgtC) family protein
MSSLVDLAAYLQLELLFRILVAFLLGGVLGFERERVRRPAGLRTHMLVAAGSSAFTVASIYGFAGHGTVQDAGRVAAQIVTGIGFLGAGTIFRTPNTVRGLTTAASIWLVAAIGMLIGTGMYVIGIFATLLGLYALRWLKTPERRRRVGEPSIVAETDDDDSDERD